MEGEGGDGELDGMQNLAVNNKEAKVTEEEKKEKEEKVKNVEETEVEKGIYKGGVIPLDGQPKKASVIFCCKMNCFWKSCITQTNICRQDYLQ